jgi:hypothetical protein
VGYSMGDDEAFRRSASERIDGRYQIEVQFEQREFVMIELMEKWFVFSMGGGEGSGGAKVWLRLQKAIIANRGRRQAAWPAAHEQHLTTRSMIM